MSDFKKFILTNKGSLTRWGTELNSYKDSPSVLVEEFRLDAISKGVIEKLCSVRAYLNDEYVSDNPDSNDIAEGEDFADRCETLSSLSKMILRKRFTEPVAPQNVVAAKLPKIDITPFYGDIEKFDQFWSLFRTCVDQCPSLSDACKFGYLVSLLKGEASSVVAGMIVSPLNYDLAKNLLVDRYGQSMKLVHSIFQKILDLPFCGNSVKDIRTYYDNLIVHVRSLENRGIKIDDHSVILSPQILSKLPDAVRFKCVSTFKDNDWLVSDILDVLRVRVRCGEACDFQLSSSCETSFNHLSSTFASLATNSKPCSKQSPVNKPHN